MAGEEHTRRHAEGANAWVQRNYMYPNLVTAREGQRILSPMDTCVVRGAVGGLMGGALGVGFGLIMHMSGPASGLGAVPIPGQPQMNVTPPPVQTSAGTNTAARFVGPAAATGSNAVGAQLTSAASHASAASSTAAAPALSTAGAASASTSVTTLLVRGSALAASASAPAVPLGPAPAPRPVIPTGFGVADPIYGQAHTPELSTWKQVQVMARDTGRMAKGNFKTWGLLSGTFAFSECTIEQYRGRSDELNPLLAGCTTGAVLAARSGPQGMAIGCASFAAFSYAMEKVMHNMM